MAGFKNPLHQGSWQKRAVGLTALALGLSSCSEGAAEGGGHTLPSQSASAPVRPSPTPARPFAVDPARLPKTAKQGEALADYATIRAADWGTGFVSRPEGAESTPRTVAVLDVQCRWRRQPLPAGVLASLTRYAELPGRDGKGTVQVTAMVTVHTTDLGADDQLSVTLEDALRCPRQEARPGEYVGELASTWVSFHPYEPQWADETVYESGIYVTSKGTYPYQWSVARHGSVVVAASVKGAEGYSFQEMRDRLIQSLVDMGERVEDRIGREK